MRIKPFIVAELSGNHNGDISRALKLIEAAKEAGADAVKLQTYTADTITVNSRRPEYLIKGGLWDGYNLYDLYKVAHTPWEWHPELFAAANKLGIIIFSTPFDETAVDFLESLNAPIYKIASFELVHHPLIAKVAKTGKPVIMSTGMATVEEITEAVEVATKNGCKDLTLLHCVSEYPAPIEHCNLQTMVDLQKRFPQVKVGLSDHTQGTTVAVTAVALGATVIEKHFTLSRAEGGVDSAFSLEPHELKQLCEATRDAALAVGEVNYQRSSEEIENKKFRRSVVALRDIKPGEQFTPENLGIKRPGYGIAPKYIGDLYGKEAQVALSCGEAITPEIYAEHTAKTTEQSVS